MQYGLLIKSLIKEARAGTKYKQLTIGKGFIIIPMIPLIILNFFLVAWYYVLLFLYNATAAPVSHLENWQREKAKNVKHATEAVIYFTTMPMLFIFQIILCFFSLTFYFLWFFINLATYIVTLCGTKWQPFINESTFEDVELRRFKRSYNTVNTYIIIVFVFAMLSVLGLLISLVSDSGEGIFFLIAEGITMLLLYLSPLAFCNGEAVVNKPAAQQEEIRTY